MKLSAKSKRRIIILAFGFLILNGGKHSGDNDPVISIIGLILAIGSIFAMMYILEDIKDENPSPTPPAK